MKMPDVIPLSWKIGAALVLVAGLLAVDAWRVHAAYNDGYKLAIAERKASDLTAVVVRVRENAAEAIKNESINSFITKAKNEEIKPVIQRIYVDRVRIGAASCGPAASTETSNAGGGDGADSSSRLVREDVERDTRALIEAVETDLATGRACQEFGRQHGFMQ